MTGRVLDVCVDAGDQAMWDDARWESRVDKGAGVDTGQGGEGRRFIRALGICLNLLPLRQSSCQ